MKLYSHKDVDKKALKGARIAILGYGSQGRAHALNLKDSASTSWSGCARAAPAGRRRKPRRTGGRRAGRGGRGRRSRGHADPGHGAEGVLPGHQEAAEDGRHAAVRARLQHPLQPDQAAQGPRRGADRPQGAGRSGAPPVPAGARRAVSARGGAGRERPGAGAGARLRARHRRHARRGARDDVRGRDRDRSVRRAGGAVRRRHRAGGEGLRDPGRGRLPARGRLLRVPARAEADRRPAARGRHLPRCTSSSPRPPSTAT